MTITSAPLRALPDHVIGKRPVLSRPPVRHQPRPPHQPTSTPGRAPRTEAHSDSQHHPRGGRPSRLCSSPPECRRYRECAAAAESESFGVWGAVDVTPLTTRQKRVQALTETRTNTTNQPKENHA